MGEYFSLPGGFIAAETAIEANGISGNGRAEAPILQVAIRMLFRCPKNPGTSLDFRELRCRVSPFDGVYFAASAPTYLNCRLTAGAELPNELVYVEIPVDRPRLALLNRLRNGGDVRLRLDFELFVDELVEVGRSQNHPNSSVWGLREHHRMFAKVQAEIARSKWAEQVLLQTEFAKIHFLELPAIPIESCAEMKDAFNALQHACKLENQGFYVDAIAKCRIALEPFMEMIEQADGNGGKRRVPILKASWETRLGKATYDWLNSAFIATKQATNQTHHLSSATFGQLEAQMILTVATAVVAYAVKTRPDSPPVTKNGRGQRKRSG
jgi:hypothetical protein